MRYVARATAASWQWSDYRRALGKGLWKKARCRGSRAGMKRICIITPGNVSSNPRVVKEADALVEAGYEVRVVAGDMVPWVRERDATIFARARWRCDLVGPGSYATYSLHRVRRAFAKRALAVGFGGVSVAAAAHGTMTGQLTVAVTLEPADSTLHTIRHLFQQLRPLRTITGLYSVLMLKIFIWVNS